jgi:HPr kinase/phosphorylase
MSKSTPAIIVARNQEIPQEMITAAKNADMVLLQSRENTSRLSSIITTFLDGQLAERTPVHGVLMDIYGLGVLIQGDSGIGKSETALDLVTRGHRLVADDRVDVFQKDAFTVAGEPAELLKNLLELRGVGIIDVMSLYGARAVKEVSNINLAIHLEAYDPSKEFDRLGSDCQISELSGVEVPQIKIPVQTGRNVTTIIEAAVANFSAKQMGFDTTEKFYARLTKQIELNK